MAARSPNRHNREPFRLSTALSSACSEWILIILLLIDALCIYLATKIFRSCKLQAPCLLCSRLGHLLSKEKFEYYNNLVCESHKLEISSLVFCHVHRKLANAREMCESCLLSLTKKMSSLEICKLFLSKFQIDLKNGENVLNSSSIERVNAPLLKKSRDAGSPHTKACSCCSQPSKNSHDYKLSQSKPVFKEISARLSVRDHLPARTGKAKDISMPHFRYRELKINSESESEFPLSEDDDGGVLVQSLRASPIINVPKKLLMISDTIVPEKFIHPDPAISIACSSSTLKSQNVDEKPLFQASSQMVSKHVLAVISNGKDLLDVDASETPSTSHVEIKEHSDLTDQIFKADIIMSEIDHNLAKDFQPSSITELSKVSESKKLHEDLKQGMSQVFTPKRLQSPWTDLINVCRKEDDSKLCHTSSFNDLPHTNKKQDAELSFSEIAEGNNFKEAEGDVSVEHLKKQIEGDKKSLSILYKELEEERNASAIAANQAMAMITKLQEEKAAMQLEIMQYLRMMEEQTEYEQEALRNLNDQLTEREKEIQDLEAEIDSLRNPSREESFAEKILEPSYDSDESEYSTTSTPHVIRPRRKKKHHLPSSLFRNSACSTVDHIKENLFDFEEDKEYISECLKRMEKDVRLFSCVDASQYDEDDDEFNDETFAEDTIMEDLERRGVADIQEINQTKEMISSEKHLSPHMKTNCISSLLENDCQIVDDKNNNRLNSSCIDKTKSKISTRKDGIAPTDEVSHLNARLEALEADRNFLERAINSLKKGKDGVQFVQEIAANLRELRKIGLAQRENAFA